ncbi:hypothetical protein LTR66_016896 [Elasticomyces elasticus]|nr:hypothetical protein LTR66_016896 [Elasticomyces elasticus]
MHEIEPSTISSFHVYSDMSNYTFVSPLNNSRVLQTCSAALGYGFAGGTTDGPGAFDFRQGTNDTDDDSPALKNPLWKIARGAIHPPSEEQKACQSPKPILLDVGAAKSPYAWTPNIVDIQMMRVGNLVIIVAPGEATTMSGRRWRQAIAAEAIQQLEIANPVVVLGGPANTYAHYIATEEEYGVQRYEGASTLYGPHTLEAYINLTSTYLPYLSDQQTKGQLLALERGPSPPINVNKSLSFINGVVVDNAGDVASATFVGANPRNNLRLEQTFAAVEVYDTTAGSWQQVRDDKDWHLVYHWVRKSTILGTSEVKIDWEIEDFMGAAPTELYRIRYYGDSKSLGGSITAFEGVSGTFYVGSGQHSDPSPELIKLG